MHEAAIVQKIIGEAKKISDHIHGVELEVGELAKISPDEIAEVLEEMTDWHVHVHEKESKIKCSCGFEGRARILDRGHGYCVYNCPKCEGRPEVLEGGDIKIVGVDGH